MPDSVKSFGSVTSGRLSISESSNFSEIYERICTKLHKQPINEVKINKSQGHLSLIGDRIKYEDWIPIVRSLKIDKSLHFISLRSRLFQKEILYHIDTSQKAKQLTKESVMYTKYVLEQIIKAISECITNSKALMSLELQKIPLNENLISNLSTALEQTKSLQNLSLSYCNVGDHGCKLLTRALRDRYSLVLLDLSNCELTEIGAFYIADLIKAQSLTRYNEVWKHSLRYREICTENTSGLRRIILNNNSIGDKGCEAIVEALHDDYWIKAIDMQNCGLTDQCSKSLEELLNKNDDIVVFDIRRNYLNDSTMVKLILALEKREDPNYRWLVDSAKRGSSVGSSSGSTINSVKSAPRLARNVHCADKKVKPQLKTCKSVGLIGQNPVMKKVPYPRPSASVIISRKSDSDSSSRTLINTKASSKSCKNLTTKTKKSLPFETEKLKKEGLKPNWDSSEAEGSRTRTISPCMTPKTIKPGSEYPIRFVSESSNRELSPSSKGRL